MLLAILNFLTVAVAALPNIEAFLDALIPYVKGIFDALIVLLTWFT